MSRISLLSFIFSVSFLYIFSISRSFLSSLFPVLCFRTRSYAYVYFASLIVSSISENIISYTNDKITSHSLRYTSLFILQRNQKEISNQNHPNLFKIWIFYFPHPAERTNEHLPEPTEYEHFNRNLSSTSHPPSLSNLLPTIFFLSQVRVVALTYRNWHLLRSNFDALSVA